MKKLIKISTFCAVFALIFCLFAFTAAANSEMPDGSLIEGAITPSETVESTDEEEFENIFETVYGTLIENSDKIFSTLAFIASLIIAFLYKKNFMPTVKNSIGSITSALSKFSEESGKKIGNASALIDSVNARLLETEDMLSNLSDNLSAIEEALKDKSGDTERLETLKKVMTAEVDMLYEIFMTSSLPQYKKEEVGEKISTMKKELLAEENANG